MRRALTIVALALAAISVVVVAVVFLGFDEDGARERAPSGTSRTAICGNCALKRHAVTQEWGDGRPDEHTEEIEDTALSKALASWGAPPCSHDWFQINGTGWQPGGHGHMHVYGDSGALSELAESTAGAQAVIGFAEATGRRPRAVWRSLARWTQLADVDRFSSRLPDTVHGDRAKIIGWLKQSYAHIEREATSWSGTRSNSKRSGSKSGKRPSWLKRAD